MFKNIFKKIVGDPTQKYLDSLYPTLDEVNEMADEYKAKTDVELRLKSTEFRDRIDAGESLEDFLIEAFALVREASIRAK